MTPTPTPNPNPNPSPTASPNPTPTLSPNHILRIRLAHGANCSSVGSVVDLLFATSTVSAALLAAIVTTLRTADIEVVTPAQDDPNLPHPRDPHAPPP